MDVPEASIYIGLLDIKAPSFLPLFPDEDTALSKSRL